MQPGLEGPTICLWDIVQIFNESHYEFDSRMEAGEREPEIIRWIIENHEIGTVFYDVGAGIGAFSLVVATYLSDNGKTYAFEPAFPSYRNMCRNILIGDKHTMIIPINAGLWSSTQMVDFNYVSFESGASGHGINEDKPKDYIRSLPVMMWALDDWISAQMGPCPTMMRIDIDGYEYRMLTGASDTLNDPRLRTVMISTDERREDAPLIYGFMTKHDWVQKEKHKRSVKGMFNCIYYRK